MSIPSKCALAMSYQLHKEIFLHINPISATRRDSRHQNKVKVKGLGTNSSYVAGFSILFHGSMTKFNQLAKKNYLKFFSLA